MPERSASGKDVAAEVLIAYKMTAKPLIGHRNHVHPVKIIVENASKSTRSIATQDIPWINR
jgi:hypothetical protein